MWLSKDERRLLAGYFTQIGEIGTEKVYLIADLSALLSFRGYRAPIVSVGSPEASADHLNASNTTRVAASADVRTANRIRMAHKLLAERGLIMVSPHQHDSNAVVIGLTLDGYDYGRRYSSFWASSGLWFREYRNHWIWLIVAFFGGAVGAKLIDLIVTID